MTKEEIKQYFIDLYVKHIKQEDITEWANWIAMDSDGTVWIYQEKPLLGVNNYFNDTINGEACQVAVSCANKTLLKDWAHSLLRLEGLLAHHSSQEEEPLAQDKIEFEAVSGDQSLFDLVGADDKDRVIVKSLLSKAIFAMADALTEYTILAERKLKEKPYIPEVGHTYKLSGIFDGEFTCVFVDDGGRIWSTCGGSMFSHDPDNITSRTIQFIRVG